MEKVSNVLCHSENLGSRQEEWKMLRMQLQLKIQMHIDPLLERLVGVFWTETSRQLSQEENICELF